MQYIKAKREDFVWSYAAYSLSIGSNILILPFILYFLSPNEVGLWFTFLSIAMLANLVDFGFSPSILRNTSYIWSGAKELKKKGISNYVDKGKPNFILLDQMINTARIIYLAIATIALIFVLTLGSLFIIEITEGYNIENKLFSWFVFVIGIFLNIAFNFWTPLLKGIGEIKKSQKALVLSKITFIIISIILLNMSYGLLGIAISYTISGFILRFFSRNYFLSFLKNFDFKPSQKTLSGIDTHFINKIFYNAWRLGVVSLGAFAILQSNTLICSYYFGLEYTASYGLVIQIFAVIAALANTPYQTYLPEFNQLLSFNNYNDAKKIIIKSAKLNWIIFIFFSFLVILFLPFISAYLMQSKFYITQKMLIFMSIYLLLENNHSLFSGFIAAENKIPFMKAGVLSGIGVVSLSLIFIYFTELGIWSLLISPALVQLVYNNWKWPYYIFKKYKINLGSFRYDETTYSN